MQSMFFSHTRLQAFTSRPDVAYACLFFDAHLQDFPYLGHGYVSPGMVGAAPKGVETLPSILIMPTVSGILCEENTFDFT